jgi:hypothetical protein
VNNYDIVFHLEETADLPFLCAQQKRDIWLIWDNDRILPYYPTRYPEGSIWFGDTATNGHSGNSAY